MKFIDEVVVDVRSGRGGHGCVAWRREPFVPRGGPAGGNGGGGGDVVLVTDTGLHTLFDLRFRPLIKAANGESGGGARRTGARGADAVIRVPVGTIVFDAETGDCLADLDRSDSTLVVASGGHPGRGNASFKSATRRAPDTATEGTAGEERRLRLELKLLADVGLVGLPNAGKSTFISRVSNARPKIADYHFTTLAPNLGVVERSDAYPFVIADIPGLVEGAHEGTGLGHQFLRHIERTAVLAYLVDQDEMLGRDAVAAYDTLRQELSRYDEELAARPSVLVLNKLDLPDVIAVEPAVRALAKERGIEFFAVSAVTGAGVEPLLQHLGDIVASTRQRGDSDG